MASFLIGRTYQAVVDWWQPGQLNSEIINKPCRYLLDDSTSKTFTLSDGRQLGYAEYGSPTGRPIIYCGGLPGSRKDGAFQGPVAKRLNARIIAVERPGEGWSSPQPGRQLLDHARDIEQLANHLGLENYGVLGISGGGPYALACAKALPPEKLRAVAVVSGLGTRNMSKTGMCWFNWLGLAIGFRLFPSAIRWYFAYDVTAQLRLSDEEHLRRTLHGLESASLPHQEAALWNDTDLTVDVLRMQRSSLREAFAQGLHGPADDGRTICSDWDFRVEDIRKDLPIHLWYGRDDVNVPPVHGQQLFDHIGGNARLRIEAETHTSLQLKYDEEIQKALLDSM